MSTDPWNQGVKQQHRQCGDRVPAQSDSAASGHIRVEVEMNRCIGIDPSYGKPIAAAWRVNSWQWIVAGVTPMDVRGCVDVITDAASAGVTTVIIEGGYLGVNPKVALKLEHVRAWLAAHAEVAGLKVVTVAPKTWQVACLTQGNWTPSTHREIVRQAKFRAKAVTGMDLSEDRAVAVCLAEWGEANT